MNASSFPESEPSNTSGFRIFAELDGAGAGETEVLFTNHSITSASLSSPDFSGDRCEHEVWVDLDRECDDRSLPGGGCSPSECSEPGAKGLLGES